MLSHTQRRRLSAIRITVIRSIGLLGLATAFIAPIVATAKASQPPLMHIAVNTIVFTNDPVVPGVTPIKGAHLTELREAVNAARGVAGQQPLMFIDPSPVGASVKAVHISELRTALESARSALRLPSLAYTDPAISTGTAVKAVHIQELRDAARRVVDGCPAITVATPVPTTFTVNTPLTKTFTQNGAASGATFSMASGTLPAGVTLLASGALSGTPTQTGTFPITVRTMDQYGCSGVSASYALNIVPAPMILTFSAPTNPALPGTTMTLTGTFSGGTGMITNDSDGQIVVAVSGTGNAVNAPPVDTHYTLTVTNAAGDHVASSVTVVIAAVVHFNEVNVIISGGCDLIELRVVSGGSMGGTKIQERMGEAGRLAFTFPTFRVLAGDFIVVHMSGTNQVCNPQGATQETVSKSDQSTAMFPNNFDSAYDFWSLNTGIVSTDTVLTAFSASGTIIDALFASNDPTGTSTAASTLAAANLVGAANQWSPALLDYSATAFRMNAANDLDATGTAVGGMSMQRVNDTDLNSKNDWTTGPGLPSTWGRPNAGQF